MSGSRARSWAVDVSLSLAIGVVIAIPTFARRSSLVEVNGTTFPLPSDAVVRPVNSGIEIASASSQVLSYLIEGKAPTDTVDLKKALSSVGYQLHSEEPVGRYYEGLGELEGSALVAERDGVRYTGATIQFWSPSIRLVCLKQGTELSDQSAVAHAALELKETRYSRSGRLWVAVLAVFGALLLFRAIRWLRGSENRKVSAHR